MIQADKELASIIGDAPSDAAPRSGAGAGAGTGAGAGLVDTPGMVPPSSTGLELTAIDPPGLIREDLITFQEFSLLQKRFDPDRRGDAPYQRLAAFLLLSPSDILLPADVGSGGYVPGTGVTPDQAADMAEITLQRELQEAEARGVRVLLRLQEADMDCGRGGETGELRRQLFRCV